MAPARLSAGAPAAALAAVLCLAFLAGCALAQPAAPDPAAVNGRLAAPEFQLFIEELGGSLLFGEPIGGAFPDRESGRLVQYFRNFRLELDQATGAVAIAPLGQLFAPAPEVRLAAPLPAESSWERFPGSNYALHDEFLSFYRRHQGQLLLGPAITPSSTKGARAASTFAMAFWSGGRTPRLPIGFSRWPLARPITSKRDTLTTPAGAGRWTHRS
jgi:hypothetical protein